MKAFLVSVNGQQVCTAGIDSLGVVNVIINWIRRDGEPADGEFDLSIGGLVTPANEYLWWPAPSLTVGDEITVRIVESDAIDPPVEREVKKPTSTRAHEDSTPKSV